MSRQLALFLSLPAYQAQPSWRSWMKNKSWYCLWSLYSSTIRLSGHTPHPLSSSKVRTNATPREGTNIALPSCLPHNCWMQHMPQWHNFAVLGFWLGLHPLFPQRSYSKNILELWQFIGTVTHFIFLPTAIMLLFGWQSHCNYETWGRSHRKIVKFLSKEKGCLTKFLLWALEWSRNELEYRI